jgi:transketolase
VTDLELEQRAISVVRGLAMDAPHAARSGHQGTAMALAPLAHVLWTRILRYDASDPTWPDRDRVVLSAGHASILLYSMLHLTGHGLTLDDLEGVPPVGEPHPGHPEAGHDTPGVEVTTGPLGQGVGNSVGMAIAERFLRARFGSEVCDHRTFAICSDGDLMEGLSHEAASLAGHLGLDRLCWIYDDNRITIDGRTDLAYSDDVVTRFRGYRWNVVELGEPGDDLDAIERGLRSAIAHEGAPTLVVIRTRVGYPSPNYTDHHEAHGYVMKDDEIAATKERLGLPVDQTFHVPDDVLDVYRAAGARGAGEHRAWSERIDRLDDDEAARWSACQDARPLPGSELTLPSFEVGESMATRVASGRCIEALADAVPGLLVGGADLTGNTGTTFDSDGIQNRDEPGGRQIYYGIREHAQAAALNGMARHGGVLPVGGTFFVFSDYMRPSVRLAALSRARSVFVWTHDSVGVGEDGPTHQPIEQLASLRAMPGLSLVPASRRRGDRRGLGRGPRRRRTGRAGALPPGPARAAGHRPHQGRPGRLRRRRDRRVARGGARRHRQRGICVRRCGRAARLRGDRRPGGLDALLGPVPTPGPRVPHLGAPRRAPASRSRREPPSAGTSGSTRPSASTASVPAHPAARSSTAWASTSPTSSPGPVRWPTNTTRPSRRSEGSTHGRLARLYDPARSEPLARQPATRLDPGGELAAGSSVGCGASRRTPPSSRRR